MANRTLLRGGNAVLPGHGIVRADVLIDDGTIASIAPAIEPPEGADTRDVEGLTLLPGFIDVHVHGGGGHSLITSDAEEIREYARWAVSRGVTSFLATVCADSLAGGCRAVEAAASVAGPVDDGATILGVNLEGPFLSPQRPGAIPPGWIVPPSAETLTQLLDAAGDTLRVMTVAPEVEGAKAVVDGALSAGVRLSVGHTDATFEQAAAAFANGASHVTHAFNAMRPLHHREPGVLAAALAAEEVTIEVIADGVHLHPGTVRLLGRAFGVDRVCLVTDAVAPAGLHEGVFRIGGHEARLSGGSVRLPDGTIAGSAATMDSVVRNVVEWGIADLAGASTMASGTPARAAGIAGQKGELRERMDADIVALDDALEVVATWVAGQLVYDGGGIMPRQEGNR
jgi:N-acetylglucosamine-6-phosphate deacetylase